MCSVEPGKETSFRSTERNKRGSRMKEKKKSKKIKDVGRKKDEEEEKIGQ